MGFSTGMAAGMLLMSAAMPSGGSSQSSAPQIPKGLNQPEAAIYLANQGYCDDARAYMNAYRLSGTGSKVSNLYWSGVFGYQEGLCDGQNWSGDYLKSLKDSAAALRQFEQACGKSPTNTDCTDQRLKRAASIRASIPKFEERISHQHHIFGEVLKWGLGVLALLFFFTIL